MDSLHGKRHFEAFFRHSLAVPSPSFCPSCSYGRFDFIPAFLYNIKHGDELRLLRAGPEKMLEEFKCQLFGTKSEKTKTAPASAGDEPENPLAKTAVKEHTRTKKKKVARDERYVDIPIRDVIIPVPDKDCLCPYCNAEMALPGHREVRTELRITPAKAERIRYMQEELICPECRKDGDGTIVQAETPAPLMAHSPASPSVVAYVMFGKSFISVPYCRQEARMARLGLELPRETMVNWHIKCAMEYFWPMICPHAPDPLAEGCHSCG